ncbi:hypothetical protein [Vibrio sp. TRT 17S01]|uniref:hypothetical protein n=1 Tax=Vibrio sp. TRT 17S01 TaxID=3418505 RepID=UPI003CE73B8C
MNKDTFEQALMYRLLVEQNYSLLLDADQHSSQLPEQQTWADKLERSDSESYEQDIIDYLEACEAHQETLPVIGGELINTILRQDDEVVWKPSKSVIPSLQPLKNYANRVLVKINPMGTKVLLFTDANCSRVGKKELTQICNEARSEVLDFFGIEKNNLHTVMITVVMVRELDCAARQFAKQNTKRVALDKNFFHYLCVDLQNKRIWTPTSIRSWTEVNTIKKVFSSKDSSIESLYANFNAVTFSWWRVILSGLVAFTLTLLLSIVALYYESGLLYTLGQALTPMVVFTLFFATMKNNSRVYKQVCYGISIYVLLVVSLYLTVTFPSDFGDWLNLVQLIFISAGPSLLIGRTIEIMK